MINQSILPSLSTILLTAPIFSQSKDATSNFNEDKSGTGGKSSKPNSFIFLSVPSRLEARWGTLGFVAPLKSNQLID